MEQSIGSSPDRNILCLFDVDGTLTAPREVRERASRRHGAALIGYRCHMYACHRELDRNVPSAGAL